MYFQAGTFITALGPLLNGENKIEILTQKAPTSKVRQKRNQVVFLSHSKYI